MKKHLLSAVAAAALVAFAGNAWADIIIGVAGPITGPNAAFGAQFQKGAEQAAADIGFSEPSAFHRAFHKWTRKSPALFRREASSDADLRDSAPVN